MNDISYRERQALGLGATLYVPADHKDLLQIASTNKTGARSLIICTEDALALDNLEAGLSNIRRCLSRVMTLSDHGVQVFIRPRDTQVLARLLAMPNIERVAGFVLPKFDCKEGEEWAKVMLPADPQLGVMPTLETADVFNMDEMRKLCGMLTEGSLANRVIALRIGGNDLLNCLSLRRPRNLTLYDTPLGAVISQLVGVFKPHGFYLTAPVFEHFGDMDGLRRELQLDRAHGLVGKTAIHPCQLGVIEHAMAPTPMEVDEANAILAADAKAVFKMNDSMCEVATHHKWAQRILYLNERNKAHPYLKIVA